MKITLTTVIYLCVFTLTTFCSATLEDQDHIAIDRRRPLVSNHEASNINLHRQRKNQKPAKPHPQAQLFTAISSLLGETVVDTLTAYRNVSRLITTAFVPPKQRTGNATALANSPSFTLRQSLALLDRNYRGLRRLFHNEFTKALNVSVQNAVDFHKELKNSTKMYFEYDNDNSV